MIRCGGGSWGGSGTPGAACMRGAPAQALLPPPGQARCAGHASLALRTPRTLRTTRPCTEGAPCLPRCRASKAELINLGIPPLHTKARLGRWPRAGQPCCCAAGSVVAPTSADPFDPTPPALTGWLPFRRRPARCCELLRPSQQVSPGLCVQLGNRHVATCCCPTAPPIPNTTTHPTPLHTPRHPRAGGAAGLCALPRRLVQLLRRHPATQHAQQRLVGGGAGARASAA